MLNEKILNSLEEIENYGNQLAYFGLTSKVELPFRDWLAFNLMEKSNNEYLIGREYPNRSDLSLIINNKTIHCLELKACYTFDLYKDFQTEWNKVLNDLSKYETREEKVSFMLIALHPLSKFDINAKENLKLIKYLNKHMRFQHSPNNTLDAICTNIVNNCHTPHLKLKCHGFKTLGQAFNIETGLVYFLWEKV
ncbi:hypothetical protein [Fusobacterium ulcerans]|uniref:hypothetical protein n=1 Tax=Fusobacterium ulcerans TaxID=861 RepID=UPI001D0AAA7D|nr:hypothetical protein [Fusobacterium ulcerans]MCB8565792.1 hypothetical protein [Fusobacterium ulcerans]MCB8650641.1 hypothetical protein [Fusobacterium ulcerans]